MTSAYVVLLLKCNISNIILTLVRIVNGGGKAKTFEPLAEVVEWLFENKEMSCASWLAEASLIDSIQGWQY